MEPTGRRGSGSLLARGLVCVGVCRVGRGSALEDLGDDLDADGLGLGAARFLLLGGRAIAFKVDREARDLRAPFKLRLTQHGRLSVGESFLLPRVAF